MIPAETHYKTHNEELLAIVEAFKTWRHYFKGCKREFFVLTNHNNLYWFMDTKSLSSSQVRLAQELFRYHFRINYCQGKANEAADALSCFSQRSSKEEKVLQAKNTKILHRLQSSLVNASLSGLSLHPDLLPHHQVLICGTYVLAQLRHFWNSLRGKLANERLYIASIRSMRLRLSELQGGNLEVKKFRGAKFVAEK